jgi:hypothetical protein
MRAPIALTLEPVPATLMSAFFLKRHFQQRSVGAAFRLRVYQTQYTVGTTWSPAAELTVRDDFAPLFGATPSSTP